MYLCVLAACFLSSIFISYCVILCRNLTINLNSSLRFPLQKSVSYSIPRYRVCVSVCVFCKIWHGNAAYQNVKFNKLCTCIFQILQFHEFRTKKIWTKELVRNFDWILYCWMHNIGVMFVVWKIDFKWFHLVYTSLHFANFQSLSSFKPFTLRIENEFFESINLCCVSALRVTIDKSFYVNNILSIRSIDEKCYNSHF